MAQADLLTDSHYRASTDPRAPSGARSWRLVLSMTAGNGAGAWRSGRSVARLWAAGGDGMSGCGGDAGAGDVAGGELVEGVERRGELRGRVGPVRCHQRAQDVVVDLGVEVSE
jgi:hypothetical protein